LFTSILALLAFPVLTAALLVLEADRRFGSHVLGYWDGPVRRRAEDGSAMWRRLWDLRGSLR
ncbi:hypothetical protein AB0G21_35170, partial [Streptomyces sp. NPDC023588]